MNGEFPTDQAIPVCTTAPTITAAFDLLVALCTQCVPNLKCVALMLMEMFYNSKYTNMLTLFCFEEQFGTLTICYIICSSLILTLGIK